jgi:hypothetical protein
LSSPISFRSFKTRSSPISLNSFETLSDERQSLPLADRRHRPQFAAANTHSPSPHLTVESREESSFAASEKRRKSTLSL